MNKRTSRGLVLTAKGRAAIGVSESVNVPLLVVPWRDDVRDRSER